MLTMRAGRLNDIVILRSISILLVVFVHSFYIYNYGSLSDIDTIVIKIERFFNLGTVVKRIKLYNELIANAI